MIGGPVLLGGICRLMEQEASSCERRDWIAELDFGAREVFDVHHEWRRTGLGGRRGREAWLSALKMKRGVDGDHDAGFC
jgi:hypothetical protein